MGPVDDIGLVFLFRIGKALPESIDIDHHDLDIRAGGKISDIRQFAGIIDKIIKADIFIQFPEMVRQLSCPSNTPVIASMACF
jgi:hypothetical protein